MECLGARSAACCWTSDAGPGLLLEALAERGGTVALAGVDISAEMGHIAAARLRGRADRSSGRRRGAAVGRSAVRVCCVGSCHHYPRPDRTLAKTPRVLGCGGRLVIADPTAPAGLRKPVDAIIRVLGRADVQIYGRGEVATMRAAQELQRFTWTSVAIWGFVATAVAGQRVR
jgi:SAM-dependent methyltransferase